MQQNSSGIGYGGGPAVSDAAEQLPRIWIHVRIDVESLRCNGMNANKRTGLIKTIKTPFNFFALIVLCCETFIGIVAPQMQAGSDRTLLLWAGVLLLGLLTAIVTLLLFTKPWVLSGGPPPSVTIHHLSPPPYLATTPRIRYFLRGVRDSYLNALTANGRKLPQHVRLNVMLILPAAPKNHEERVLKIAHVDYPTLFSNDEFSDEYPIGSAKCGEAWQLKQQRFWADDLSDTKRVPPKKKTSRTADALKSVVSSPFYCEGGECIGVLNLDSNEDSKSTCVQMGVVHDLLDSAARDIVPLLFPRMNANNGA